MPVTEALYHASGKPPLGKTVPFDSGFCGRCHQQTTVAEASKVLTSRFGSWDDIDPDVRGKRRYLCLPCGWAYREKQLQYHPTIIRRGEEALKHPTGTELRSALNGPIPSDTAILLPVSGKKAVAPLGQWGRLVTDGGPVEWNRQRAQAVAHLRELKAMGIVEMALSGLAPPAYVLDRVDAAQWEQVQKSWSVLRPFREDKALFPMLVKLTREKM